jgi:hypothetical protein
MNPVIAACDQGSHIPVESYELDRVDEWADLSRFYFTFAAMRAARVSLPAPALFIIGFVTALHASLTWRRVRLVSCTQHDIPTSAWAACFRCAARVSFDPSLVRHVSALASMFVTCHAARAPAAVVVDAMQALSRFRQHDAALNLFSRVLQSKNAAAVSRTVAEAVRRCGGGF